jgi:hypothetical protein
VDELLKNSDFSPLLEVIIPRIEEWLVQKPFSTSFSIISNSSKVFEKLVEYVVESERGFIPRISLVYSSNENTAFIEFEKGPVKEAKLALLYRASENEYSASAFHGLCDGEGPNITLFKTENGQMAAAYNSFNWGAYSIFGSINPHGFVASIAEDPVVSGGHSFQKYDSVGPAGRVFSFPYRGPHFGAILYIAEKCNENYDSCSNIGESGWGYNRREGERITESLHFESPCFKVLEYEVFQVELTH